MTEDKSSKENDRTSSTNKDINDTEVASPPKSIINNKETAPVPIEIRVKVYEEVIGGSAPIVDVAETVMSTKAASKTIKRMGLAPFGLPTEMCTKEASKMVK